jgi:hypothetical protein
MVISEEQQLVDMFAARGVVHDMAPQPNDPSEAWDAFFVRVFRACDDVAKELSDTGVIAGTLWDETGPVLLRAWWLGACWPLLEQWDAFMLRASLTP